MTKNNVGPGLLPCRRPFGRRLLLVALLPALLIPTYAAPKPVSDDFLVDTIRQKLAADAVVKGGAIDVEVKDGAVVLKGKVEEEKQKNRAEKIARGVKGVKTVTNQIEIGRPELRQ
jgi:hyperosmotically inducible protein